MDEKGERALEIALKMRQPSLARTLVEHRADLCARDPRGFSLLQYAVLKEDSYSAEFIIEQLENSTNTHKLSDAVHLVDGCNGYEKLKEYDGCTALHLVTKYKAEDMLAVASRLLQAGVNPNLQDSKGW